MKKIFILVSLLVLASTVPLSAQVLSPSNIFWGTRGLVYSDWDRIYYPSYSSGIERNFIFVPFSTSSIFNTGHYTGGTSFVIGPFRVFFLGDVYFDRQKASAESLSYSYGDTPYDTDGNGRPDTYQYTWDYSYSYDKNSLDQSSMLISPGLALALGPLTGGARYIFQRVAHNNITFDYTELETITDTTVASNNIATQSDQEISLKMRDGGLVNGFAAGGSIDFGFIRIQGDLFTTVKTYGRYDMDAISRSHNLAAPGDIDGTSQDFIKGSTTTTVENGWLNFAGLNNASLIFDPATGLTHFEYQPNEPTGNYPGSFPTSIHMPQIVTSTNLYAQGELFGFIVPLHTGMTFSKLTKKSFVKESENISYASADVEQSHTTTIETLSLSSDANSSFSTGTGIVKRFHGSPIMFQVGMMYYIGTEAYNLKITRKVETTTQIDVDGDGQYTTAGVDTNTTQVQDGWYKMRDYKSTYSLFVFPVSFIFNITKNFEFFGSAQIEYYLGKEKTAFVDTGAGFADGYKTDTTTDNITGTVTPNKENYDAQPAKQYTVTSINSAVIGYFFGLRYFFNPNLIFTTQLISAEPTIDGAAGSLFANTLIAEVEFLFGKEK